MVAFGKRLKERQIQEWQGYYINYKLMKKKVKQYAHQIEVGTIDRPKVLKNFSRMLDNQIEKIVLFLLEQQGLLASKLTKLGEQQDALEERPQISKITELREVYRGGLGAVVGAVSRNLHELQDRQGSYLSIYDSPSLPLQQISYSMSLGAAATVCGIVIGAMAVAQVFSSVYFSAWSNRSYFRPLVFSSIVLFMGNALYALAYDLNSLTVSSTGSTFLWVKTSLPSFLRAHSTYIDCGGMASAGFVSASALGMACGPALAGILQTNFKFYKLTFNDVTLPGWVMAVAWLVYLIWLWFSFKEPSRVFVENNSPLASNCEKAEKSKLEKDIKQPLLITSEEKKEDDEDPEADESEEAPDEFRQPATSMVSAYRLLTPSVKVQLLIYFMLKYAMEILLSESSVVTTYYFNWSTSTVAIFLACLGLTVLPINIVVGSYISNMFEDRQILLASEIVVCIGILLSFNIIIPYSVPQYVCSGLIMFVSAEVLEGVNLSLLSRVMSSRLSRGTYNGGLLSTEAGTIARVIADATITVAGFFGQSQLLNITLLPSLVICVTSIVATCCTYNSLY
ncbi:hypothetical protein V6N12_037831 [Hibiscus sabdariffa]|uniref:SPX domain-containing protein n=1 Tax=Hibiscus sabdariffa TaxID=183260 RepID=A0ABR2B335_9ROSI